ncbi:unnamed protein product, partial [Prorocentrum cordatum]
SPAMAGPRRAGAAGPGPPGWRRGWAASWWSCGTSASRPRGACSPRPGRSSRRTAATSCSCSGCRGGGGRVRHRLLRDHQDLPARAGRLSPARGLRPEGGPHPLGRLPLRGRGPAPGRADAAGAGRGPPARRAGPAARRPRRLPRGLAVRVRQPVRENVAGGSRGERPLELVEGQGAALRRCAEWEED